MVPDLEIVEPLGCRRKGSGRSRDWSDDFLLLCLLRLLPDYEMAFAAVAAAAALEVVGAFGSSSRGLPRLPDLGRLLCSLQFRCLAVHPEVETTNKLLVAVAK